MSSDPDVVEIEEITNLNYCFIGCDGIFDCLNNEEIKKIVNSYFLKKNQEVTHEIVAKANDAILKSCIVKNCSDNVTSILIYFKFLSN